MVLRPKAVERPEGLRKCRRGGLSCFLSGPLGGGALIAVFFVTETWGSPTQPGRPRDQPAGVRVEQATWTLLVFGRESPTVELTVDILATQGRKL